MLDDVREGYVSRDEAHATYGIDIRPDGSWQRLPSAINRRKDRDYGAGASARK